MKTKQKQGQLFVIDNSVLKEIFEGEEKATDMIKKLSKLKKKAPDKISAFTTVACFLKALDEAKYHKNIKVVLDTVTIGFLRGNQFAHFDFKDLDKVIEEIIKMAKIASEGI